MALYVRNGVLSEELILRDICHEILGNYEGTGIIIVHQ